MNTPDAMTFEQKFAADTEISNHLKVSEQARQKVKNAPVVMASMLTEKFGESIDLLPDPNSAPKTVEGLKAYRGKPEPGSNNPFPKYDKYTVEGRGQPSSFYGDLFNMTSYGKELSNELSSLETTDKFDEEEVKKEKARLNSCRTNSGHLEQCGVFRRIDRRRGATVILSHNLS